MNNSIKFISRRSRWVVVPLLLAGGPLGFGGEEKAQAGAAVVSASEAQQFVEIRFSAKEIIDLCNAMKRDEARALTYMMSGIRVLLAALIEEREKAEGRKLIFPGELGMITIIGGSNECPLCKVLLSNNPHEATLKQYDQIRYHIIVDMGNDRKVWEAARRGIEIGDLPTIYAAKFIRNDDFWSTDDYLKNLKNRLDKRPSGSTARNEFLVQEIPTSPATLRDSELFRSLFVAAAFEVGRFVITSPKPNEN